MDDVPGYYYDEEKNRYFPGKRPAKKVKIEAVRTGYTLPYKNCGALYDLLKNRELGFKNAIGSRKSEEECIWEYFYSYRTEKPLSGFPYPNNIRVHACLPDLGQIFVLNPQRYTGILSFGSLSMERDAIVFDLILPDTDCIYPSSNRSSNSLVMKTTSNEFNCYTSMGSNEQSEVITIRSEHHKYVADTCFDFNLFDIGVFAASEDKCYYFSAHGPTSKRTFISKQYSDILTLGLSSSKEVLFGGHRNGSLSFWDLKSQSKFSCALASKGSIVNKMHVFQNQIQFVTVSALCAVNLWDLRMLKRPTTNFIGNTTSHDYRGSCLDLSNQYLHVSGSDNILRTWSLNSGLQNPIAEFPLKSTSNCMSSLVLDQKSVVVVSFEEGNSLIYSEVLNEI